MTSQHTDVAAYSLGLLEQQDRQEFESHLAGCASCAAELSELSGMAQLLTGIEPVQDNADQAPGADVARLLRRKAAARRAGQRRQLMLAAAASVALLAGGVGAGFAIAPGSASAPAAQLIPGQHHSATSASTGVTGTVGLVAKAWGTSITLGLGNVRGPLECQLVAVTTTGQRRIVTGWFVPAAGYGVPGHPGRLIVSGGTSIRRQDIASLAVEVVHGPTLLSIPVR
jgi:Putative zinc-finger